MCAHWGGEAGAKGKSEQWVRGREGGGLGSMEAVGDGVMGGKRLQGKKGDRERISEERDVRKGAKWGRSWWGAGERLIEGTRWRQEEAAQVQPLTDLMVKQLHKA